MSTTRKKSGIYTRKGDQGKTSLSDKSVVSKGDDRIEALGAVDELNACIGLMITYCSFADEIKFYKSLQHDLFVIGAIVGGYDNSLQVDQERIAFLEEKIDEISSELKPLHDFILPGGNVVSSWLHWLRTVCRRAERAVVRAGDKATSLTPLFDPNVIVYMNRISDLFFVAARHHNDNGNLDILWHKESPLQGR